MSGPLLGLLAVGFFIVWAWTLLRIGAIVDARLAGVCPRPCACGRTCERAAGHAGGHLCDVWWRP